MYRDLTFSVGAEEISFGFGFLSAFILSVATSIVLVSRDNLPYPKLSGDTKTQAPNYSAWTKIGELVRVISHTLATTIVAIDESRIRDPFTG